MIHQWQRLPFICINLLLNPVNSTRLQSQCAALDNNLNITAHYHDSSCYVLTNGDEVVNTTFNDALLQCHHLPGKRFLKPLYYL